MNENLRAVAVALVIIASLFIALASGKTGCM